MSTTTTSPPDNDDRDHVVNLLDLAAAAVCSTVSSARAIRAIESQQNARLKQDGSFVTDADYAAQGAIFKAIQAVSPQIRIVGEESPAEMARHVQQQNNDIDDAGNTTDDQQSSFSSVAQDEDLWQRTRREIRLLYHRHNSAAATSSPSSHAQEQAEDQTIQQQRLPLAQREPTDSTTAEEEASPAPNDDYNDDPEDCLVDINRVSVIVDPLDGTKSYTTGEYTVVSILIAIVVDNTPTFGVVGKPFGYPGLDTILDTGCATVYGGTLLNAVYVAGSRRIVVDNNNASSSATTTTTETDAPPDTDTAESSLSLPRAVISSSRSQGVTYDFCKHLAEPPHKLVHPEPVAVSGAGEKSLRLILRQHGESLWFFPKAGTSRWDVAAPDALLRVLGGKLTDKYGRVLEYASVDREEAENVQGVVACIDAELHAKCIELFQQGDWLQRP